MIITCTRAAQSKAAHLHDWARGLPLPDSRRPTHSPHIYYEMASTSQQPKGCDGVLSALDLFIQALNLAKDTCGIPPAQVAFGSASALLTMIRVRFPPLSQDGPPTHFHIGHDGERTGVRRHRAGLRRRMSSALPEIKGETTGRTQQVHPSCDWRSDCVSQTNNVHAG